VRGGDEEAPLMVRAGFRAVLEAPPERMLARLADASAQLMRRAARLLAVGESAWNQDPLLRELRERGRAATRADALDIAKALRRARVLRRGMSPQRAADVIYALTASESVYLRLVDDQGWSDSAYARMLERALVGALTG
jgi:hypothetical protein